MDSPQEAMKYVPQCLTVPLRFRIPKDDYEALRKYAEANGYSIANLSKAVMKSFVRSKIIMPMIDEIIE